MAVKRVSNFNRIIDITILDDAGKKQVEIITPRHGQKPVIEINGSYSMATSLPAFNITIKNLYLDLMHAQYSKIRVKAGYADNFAIIEGTILSLYQEGPGPDGTTVIQCKEGNLNNWLSATANVSYEPGTKLETILDQLGQKLGLGKSKLGAKAGTLSITEKFEYNGTVERIINELRQVFQEDKLVIFERDKRLCAFSEKAKDIISYKRLDYLSAPPQSNVGDSNGAYYTTVTAPWEPSLLRGDAVTFASNQYIKYYNVVGTGSKEQTIVITSYQFQFSTVGGANNMTLQGYKK